MALTDAVPDAVSDVWTHFHETVFVPENVAKEVRQVYERGAAGCCMMCGSDLREETLIHVNVLGICAVYCSHKCNQDMDVTGWLSQQYDDITEAVEFRGRSEH